MILFTLFLAFFCEYLRPLRINGWLYAWHKKLLDWAITTFDANHAIHGWVVWCIAVGLPTILIALVYWILSAIAAPLSWLFSALILYSTLSFHPFVVYIKKIQETNQDDDMYAQPTDHALPKETLLINTHDTVDAAVQYVHQHVLGLSFAYIVLAICGLGPAGAVLYYSAASAMRHSRMHTDNQQGQFTYTVLQAWRIIDWLPAHAVAVSFTAVGNFEQATHNWREQYATHYTKAHYCTYLLQAVARGALKTTIPTETTVPTPQTQASENMLNQKGTYDPTWFEDGDIPVALPHFKPLSQTTIDTDIAYDTLRLLAKLIWRTMVLWAVIICFTSIIHWIN